MDAGGWSDVGACNRLRDIPLAAGSAGAAAGGACGSNDELGGKARASASRLRAAASAGRTCATIFKAGHCPIGSTPVPTAEYQGLIGIVAAVCGHRTTCSKPKKSLDQE